MNPLEPTKVEIAADDFLARKLSIFINLTEPELDYLTRLQSRERHLAAGEPLLTQGQPIEFAYVLRDGWAIRHKMLPDGRRQVVSFVLPGDIIGAAGSFFRTAELSVETITDATVAVFKPQRLLTLARRFPRLSAALSWATAREESMLAERVVSLGRRSAYEAVAHLFMEVSQRLQAIGLAGARAFEMPVTQEQLADTLGLSLVHVNRTLKQLRKDGLIKLGQGVVTILDAERLADVPKYGARYLRHEKPPPETQEILADLGNANANGTGSP